MIQPVISVPVAACSQCEREFSVEDLMPFGESYVCADCKPIFIQRIFEGTGVPVGLTYGSVWYRFLAILIDGVLLVLINLALGRILTEFSISRAPATRAFYLRMFDTFGIVSTLLAFVYDVGFWANGGATPGKMVMGLKVVTADGLPISYGRAVGRYFARLLNLLTFGIGYLLAFFDEERRALHDRIAGTRVIAVP